MVPTRMSFAVLIVCRANLCRSPMAEALLAHSCHQAQLQWQVDSAGTECAMPDLLPDPRVMAVLKKHGLDSSHRSRQITDVDFSAFQLILAADRRVMAGLEELRPVTATARLQYLGDYDDEGEREIADPAFAVGDLAFRALHHHVQRCVDGLLKVHLKSVHQNEPEHVRRG